jgi:hypothetical protein
MGNTTEKGLDNIKSHKLIKIPVGRSAKGKRETSSYSDTEKERPDRTG